MSVDPLLTVAEVAEDIGYSPRHVRRAIAAGGLRAVRITEGSAWRVRASDLERWKATWETNEPTYRPLRLARSG